MYSERVLKTSIITEATDTLSWQNSATEYSISSKCMKENYRNAIPTVLLATARFWLISMISNEDLKHDVVLHCNAYFSNLWPNTVNYFKKLQGVHYWLFNAKPDYPSFQSSEQSLKDLKSIKMEKA